MLRLLLTRVRKVPGLARLVILAAPKTSTRRRSLSWPIRDDSAQKVPAVTPPRLRWQAGRQKCQQTISREGDSSERTGGVPVDEHGSSFLGGGLLPDQADQQEGVADGAVGVGPARGAVQADLGHKVVLNASKTASYFLLHNLSASFSDEQALADLRQFDFLSYICFTLACPTICGQQSSFNFNLNFHNLTCFCFLSL